MRRLTLFLFVLVVGPLVWLLITHPNTPLPRAWNPTEPLRVDDPVTPLSVFKLDWIAEDGAACFAALRQAGAAVTQLPDLEQSPVCHIRDRVSLRGIGEIVMDPLETRCGTALRLVMWLRHSVEPAATRVFDQPVARLRHLSSYNCRAIRTPSGAGASMSTHATADAVDIAGVDLADGTQLSLIRDWGAGADRHDFWRAARDGGCVWFETALGPEYNRLHADHFHFQSSGWGTCR
jgi:hypothetical protein